MIRKARGGDVSSVTFGDSSNETRFTSNFARPEGPGAELRVEIHQGAPGVGGELVDFSSCFQPSPHACVRQRSPVFSSTTAERASARGMWIGRLLMGRSLRGNTTAHHVPVDVRS